MLPLTFAPAGDWVVVKKVGGTPEVKKHLEDLGFVEGTEIQIVSSHGGNMIIKLKDTSLAIVREMASRIMVISG
ncbi:MAG: ferrous iron transport protein A [Bilifractor sp.]